MSDQVMCTLAYKGEANKIRELLKENGNLLVTPDSCQRIPIHWAASGNQTETFKYLLLAGSPDDLDDDTNWTPLMIAVSVGNFDITSILLKRKVRVNSANQNGQTPLHYAASKGFSDIARLLLEFGADPNISDHIGNTPIHRCVLTGKADVFVVFQSFGVRLDLNARNSEGNTPLHVACEEAQPKIALLLINAGARTDIRNIQGKLPIELASQNMQKSLKPYMH